MLTHIRVTSLVVLVVGLVLTAPVYAQDEGAILIHDDDLKEGALVSFAIDGAAVDNNVRWTFGDGASKTAEASTSHRYVDDGTYTVEAEVRRNDGTTLRARRQVEIRNVAPIIRVIGGELVSMDQTVDLEASVVDRGASDDLTYTWDFGDGTVKRGEATISHTYEESGRYEVRLTVRDGDGGEAERVESVGAGIHFVGTVGGVEVMGEATARLLHTGDKCAGYISLTDEEYGNIWVEIDRQPNIAAPGTYRTEDERLVIGFSSNEPDNVATAGPMGMEYHSAEVACRQPTTATCPEHAIQPGWLRIDRAQPETGTLNGQKRAGVIPGWQQMEDYEDLEPSYIEGSLAATTRKWTVVKKGDWSSRTPWDVYGPTRSQVVAVRFAFPAGFIHPACILPKTSKELKILRWGGPQEDVPSTSTGANRFQPAGTQPLLPDPSLLAVGPTSENSSERGIPGRSPSGIEPPWMSRAVSVDETHDRVRNGDKNVDYKRAQIHITFNKEVRLSSVDTTTVRIETRLQNGTMERAPFTKRVEGPDVILTPTRSLRSGTKYRVTVDAGSEGVRGINGEALSKADTIFFETVVDIDDVRVHTYQSSRDAPIVPNKPIATRVYVEWTEDPAIDPDWQVKAFPADVSVRLSNDDALLYPEYENIEITRPDQFGKEEKRKMEHTVNFFSPEATLPEDGPSHLYAQVRPLPVRHSIRMYDTGRRPHSLPDEYVKKGIATLSYVEGSLPTLNLVGMYMRLKAKVDTSASNLIPPDWVDRLLGNGPYVGTAMSTWLDETRHGVLEFMPFANVKIHGPIELPFGKYATLKKSTYADGSDHVYFDASAELRGITVSREIEAESYVIWSAHNFIATHANDPSLRLPSADMTIYLASYPSPLMTDDTVGGRTMPKGIEITETLQPQKGEDGLPDWKSETSKFRLVVFPIGTINLPRHTLYAVHEVGHALKLNFDELTSTADSFHTCKEETTVKELCPSRKSEVPIEGVRQDSRSWNSGVNKSDAEGNGAPSPKAIHPIALMNPAGFKTKDHFITNAAYQQLIETLTASSSVQLPRLDPLDVPRRWQSPVPNMQQFPSGPNAGPVPQERPPRLPVSESKGTILIRGAMTPDHQVLFGSVKAYDELLVTRPPDRGPYRARTLDADGNVLSDIEFEPQGYRDVHHGPDDMSELTPFSLSLADAEAVTAVEIVHEETSLFRRERSAHKPQVEFADSEPLRISDGSTVRWTGDDADGDRLTYTLAYNRGSGPWIPLMLDSDATTFTVNAQSLAPGPHPRLLLVGNDGFHTDRTVIDVHLDTHLRPIRMSPAASDTSVSESSVVTVSFSTDLDPSSITMETVQLSRNGATVPANVQRNPLGQGIILTPLRPLHPGTRYTVTLDNAIASQYGQRLEAPVTWSFRTRGLSDAPAGPVPLPPTTPTTVEDDRTDEQRRAEENAEKTRDAVRGFFEKIQEAAEEELNDGGDEN